LKSSLAVSQNTHYVALIKTDKYVCFGNKNRILFDVTGVPEEVAEKK
jgi:hypothetical protein